MPRLRVFAPFALLAIAGPLHAQRSSDPIREGVRLYNAGEYRAAVRVLDRRIREAPDDALAMILKGLALTGARDVRGAEEVWLDAAQDPYLGTAVDVLAGLSRWQRGDLVDAKMWFRFCRRGALAANSCYSLARQLADGRRVPELSSWTQLAEVPVALERYARATDRRPMDGSPSAPGPLTMPGEQVVQAGRPAPAPVVTVQPAPAPQPARPVAPRAVAVIPRGHYGCYFNNYPNGLGRSSIQWIELTTTTAYREPRGSGSYAFDRLAGTVRMISGPLAGRVAHTIQDTTGRVSLQFVRAENEVGGKPTMDIASTSCYFGQK